ncbi:trimeric intracellular cation channel family protein [Oculatella sp. LEGE 06141]|uniref:trimeric intracellular cation channel family protein n=1 Tax=Oculatella sp. LEGE 06141 TaxID=1828648 RepID=UPI001880CE63|nr:trimeric intracellular cation channel family protein [Oculatella sp. LEGE 06141]MBE9182999.1 trimeric intracellular cation channel family protein [Oculatella sp. LEGE 06141]
MILDVSIANQLQRFSFLTYVIEVSAVMSAALSGMMAARSKQMDLVGTYIVAFVNAFGGGTIRDVLLNRRPLFWVSNQEYPLLIFLLAVLFLYAPPLTQPNGYIAKPFFKVVDALGLALFSISGTSYALSFQMPYFVASLIGVITGVFGGVLRDVLLAEIPMIFRTQTSLYATCAFAGCWVFLGALVLGVQPSIAAFCGFVVIVVFRMLSLRYRITLPLPRYLAEQQRRANSAQPESDQA